VILAHVGSKPRKVKQRCFSFELKFAGSFQEKSVSGPFLNPVFCSGFSGFNPEIKEFFLLYETYFNFFFL